MFSKLSGGAKQQFKDPINEAFREFLSIKEFAGNEQEYVEDFLTRVRRYKLLIEMRNCSNIFFFKLKTEKPELYEKHFKEGLKHEILEGYFRTDGPFRSIYQQHYGNIGMFLPE